MKYGKEPTARVKYVERTPDCEIMNLSTMRTLKVYRTITYWSLFVAQSKNIIHFLNTKYSTPTPS